MRLPRRPLPSPRLAAALLALATLACGDGLRDGRWLDGRRDARPVADDRPEAAVIDSRRDGPAAVDGPDSPDAAAPPGDGPVAEDAGPGPSDGGTADAAPAVRCQTLDYQGGELVVEEARLVVPGEAVKDPTEICLRRAQPQRPRGAVGPAWDITVAKGSFGTLPTLEVTVTPPEGLRLDRLRLAQLNRDGTGRLTWNTIGEGRVDPVTGTLSARVHLILSNGNERLIHVAPVIACPSGVSACPAFYDCTAAACQ